MTIKIALVGNPNCGKTTMFNKLTGSSQRVGNWPGVTIERKEGKLKGKEDVTIVDLPGIYSLSPYSPEEIVSRDFLINNRPDAVINIVDATNLERNLYLTTQILDMGIPTVIALNMMDVMEKEGISIDTEKLSKLLGCKVVETSALRNEGLTKLIDTAYNVAISLECRSNIQYSERLEAYIRKGISAIKGIVPEDDIRWYSLKFLEKDKKVTEEADEEVQTKMDTIINELENKFDDDSECVIAGERYSFIGSIVSECVVRSKTGIKMTRSDKVDKIVTSRWLGLPIFAGVMFFVYYVSISTIGSIGTDWVNDVLFGEYIIPNTQSWLESISVNPALIGLIVDGMIGGVGAVLGFLPQILVLFVLLVILEDCGYMSRIAFVMDRVFRKFGLSGKSFIPILIGTGCGVPGIMASRAIESERDRKITVMTTTFIPCSAKLPIIAMIAGALFAGSALIALAAYFIGIISILISGIILKKWKSVSGEPSPFIMELPPYHVPGVSTVIMTAFERCWSFVKKAGTFILLACAAVWFFSSFNWNLSMVDVEASMLADFGNVICWVFTPLGWGGNWQFSVGTITGLLAKENVVGTFGVLFGYADVSEAGDEIWTAIAALITPIAGLSFLVFNLLCAPCFAAIGAMKRELGSWKATGFAVAYQCVFAYAVAMVIYQIGCLVIYGTFGIGTVSAIVISGIFVYMLGSKDPFRCKLKKASGAERTC
ncbi:MAG: ferrous iron transport protein B [Candidatus Methanomethylophilaceae archaeon]|nr:ferrous iron transport protein B [Candidatus Methanomethylophilaceae archaeon]MDY0224280.1 ferrous iron transport protein B [Candidatus Methanomethylophilaceae archaeon]